MSPKNIEEIENKNTMIQEIGQRATCPMALAYIYKHVEKSDSYIDFNQGNDEKQNIRKKLYSLALDIPTNTHRHTTMAASFIFKLKIEKVGSQDG